MLRKWLIARDIDALALGHNSVLPISLIYYSQAVQSTASPAWSVPSAQSGISMGRSGDQAASHTAFPCHSQVVAEKKLVLLMCPGRSSKGTEMTGRAGRSPKARPPLAGEAAPKELRAAESRRCRCPGEPAQHHPNIGLCTALCAVPIAVLSPQIGRFIVQ